MNSKKIATIALAAALPLATACSIAETEASPSPLEQCQKAVSEFTKYPGSAQWGEVLLDEEDSGVHYIAGEADFNNDAGNPVRTRYNCQLNLETGEWDYGPHLEPLNPVHGKHETGKWGGALSPMLEEFGDNMSMNDSDKP
ncbi:hypothetical protein [uncultured Corynebacterium sp.]|uniref:hypothetical protein n=1 Tax=uncultured Corynebacterium sp. TaxID=159447 RepID=UPI0025989132|nr:hypothetical protein [uncultured Corynebacterium sp.]